MHKLAYLSFLLCQVVFGASLHEQFAEIAIQSDRLELRWKEDEARYYEPAGIEPVKHAYTGTEIAAFVAMIQFETDMQQPVASAVPAGVRTADPVNCNCGGSHVLRFFKGGRIVAEVTYHHGTHLRSPRLNDGRDAYLTDSAAKWLRDECKFDAETAKIEAQQKQPNQALQHNDPSCHAPCVRTCRASRGRG